MTQSFTIIAQTDDCRGVNNAIRAFGLGEFERHGEPEDWTSIKLTTEHGTLQFHRLRYTEPMDEFCKTTMSMRTRIKRIDTEHEDAKQRLIDCVNKTPLLIGIVAEPDVIPEDNHENVIFACQESVEGYLFNGFAFLNEDGEVELDLEGHSEAG